MKKPRQELPGFVSVIGFAAFGLPPQAIFVTFEACGPLGPWVISNSTRSPSASDLKPSPEMALKWTNTSGPPSWEMNPYPFASLNHFTLPWTNSSYLQTEYLLREPSAERLEPATGVTLSVRESGVKQINVWICKGWGRIRIGPVPQQTRGHIKIRKRVARPVVYSIVETSGQPPVQGMLFKALQGAGDDRRVQPLPFPVPYETIGPERIPWSKGPLPQMRGNVCRPEPQTSIRDRFPGCGRRSDGPSSRSFPPPGKSPA